MQRLSLTLGLAFGCFVPVVLTGCSIGPTGAETADPGVVLQGVVHGGQQAITGAHVYLMAANTTGDAGPGIAASSSNASVSLLNSAKTGLSDSVGAYVLTDSNGDFTITSDYTCTANTQVYVYVLGGNPGVGGGANAASGLMAALGNCPGTTFPTSTYIWVNEVSTVAAAYAFSGFATDATHISSSGTPAAKAGIANASVNAAILETLSTGVANASPPPGVGYYGGGGSVPQTAVNTLGNILAACVNSTGTVTGPTNPTACYTLFTNAMSSGTTGTQPTDTATAAINIAHNPAAAPAALYGLSNSYAQFAPTLTAQPNDFTLTIYYGAGTAGYGPMVADASGNIWWSNTVVDEVNKEGYDLTPQNTYIGGNFGYTVPYYPAAIALDINGDLWSVNGNDGAGAPSLNELTPTGATGTGSPFTTLGITNPAGLALDASSNSWITNTSSPAAVIKATSAGALAATFTGGGIVAPQSVAIDPSGNAWIADNINSVIKLSGTATSTSGDTVYSGIGLNEPKAIAIDHTGNVWVVNYAGNNVIVISSTGGAVSGSSGYTAPSLSAPFSLVLDGAGNAWVLGLGVGQDAGNFSITEFSNSGAVLSGPNGFFAASGGGIAVDQSGDVWTNYESYNPLFGASYYVSEMIGAASPVVTPIALGAKNNTLGARP